MWIIFQLETALRWVKMQDIGPIKIMHLCRLLQLQNTSSTEGLFQNLEYTNLSELNTQIKQEFIVYSFFQITAHFKEFYMYFIPHKSHFCDYMYRVLMISQAQRRAMLWI